MRNILYPKQKVCKGLDKPLNLWYNSIRNKKGANNNGKHGYCKTVRRFGRIAIPKEMRRALGFKEGDPIEISVAPDRCTICLERYVENEEPSLKELLEQVWKHEELPDNLQGTVELLLNAIEEDKDS